jgi:putative restriction endonuclease
MTDLQIRLFAFDWLKDQIKIFGDTLPWHLLLRGFNISGSRYGLVGPKGIWKPAGMELPISILSTFESKYEDALDRSDQIINYNYRDLNPSHYDNVALQKVMQHKIPLVYLFGIGENKYVPVWPVYIVEDNPQNYSVKVLVDDMAYLLKDSQLDSAADNSRRAYITANSLIRVHQKGFREKVIRAYHNQCALCRLKHPELLDAAHIIGDKEDLGEPIIQNGLSLCKIHHAAFDKYIIGITPDYEVKVRQDVLEEVDGPMLKYGLQSLNNTPLILPKNRHNYPDQWRLELRFDIFRKAV